MRRLVLLSVQVGGGAVKVRKETAQRYIWIMKLGGLGLSFWYISLISKMNVETMCRERALGDATDCF